MAGSWNPASMMASGRNAAAARARSSKFCWSGWYVRLPMSLFLTPALTSTWPTPSTRPVPYGSARAMRNTRRLPPRMMTSPRASDWNASEAADRKNCPWSSKVVSDGEVAEGENRIRPVWIALGISALAPPEKFGPMMMP